MYRSGYADRNDSDLLGLLTIMGGAAFFIKRFLEKLHGMRTPPEAPIAVPPIVRRLEGTQMVVSSMTIAFGISMLLPGLVPLFVVAGILLIIGPLLFILASLLQKVARYASEWRTTGYLTSDLGHGHIWPPFGLH